MKWMTQLRLSVLVGIVIGLGIFPAHAENRIIQLKAPESGVSLNQYKIIAVKDSRIDRDRIGFMRNVMVNDYQNLSFDRSLQQSLDRYVNQYVSSSTGTDAVVLNIYEFFIFEKNSPRGAQVAVSIHFALENPDGERLLDYYDLGQSLSNLTVAARIENMIRDHLPETLNKMDEQYGVIREFRNNNRKVAVRCEPVRVPDNKKQLSFITLRALTPAHFKGTRQSETSQLPFHAETGLATSRQVLVEDGVPVVVLKVLPYFDMSNSWIIDSKSQREILEYAYTYFRITWFNAKELMNEMDGMEYTFPDMHRQLNGVIAKYDDQLKEMQQDFLVETNYNTTLDKYDNWKAHLALYAEPTGQRF